MATSKKISDTILGLIGDTPLVRINRITKGLVAADVFAKIETFNPGNSIKDRMAVKMIEDAERSGKLKPGGTIIEGTSGNTGMGLAIAAVVKGYKCIFTTTDKQSKEKVDALKAFGAEVIVCPTNVDPKIRARTTRCRRASSARRQTAWKANQYDNLSNSQAHYEQTGPEIWEQTEGRIDHLVSGVGTGGTICGAAQVSERAKAGRQGVGHRHLRVGVQEVQRDRHVRQERDLSVHHRGNRRGLPAAERRLLAHRRIREGHRQGRGDHDAPHHRARKASSPAIPPARPWPDCCSLPTASRRAKPSSSSFTITARAISARCSTTSGCARRASSRRTVSRRAISSRRRKRAAHDHRLRTKRWPKPRTS